MNVKIKDENWLVDKIVIVTGATGGIGSALVELLVNYGATVVGIARNSTKIEKLSERIRKNNPEAKINFIKCELSSTIQTKNCALKIKEKFPRIDILINNAGGYFTKRHITSEGYELTFALNYLSPFVLTNLLLPEIKNSINGEILNITSIEQKHGKLRFEDLNGERFYFGLRAYAQSKLALVVFTKELAERLKNTPIKVNAIHPGIVKTNIAQEDFSLQSLAYRLLKYTIAISPKKAAQNIIKSLTNIHTREITGAYIKNTTQSKPNPISDDPITRKKLWGISLKMAKGLPENLTI